MRLIPILIAALVLTGCARLQNSPLNPANWFGPAGAVATSPAQARPLMPSGRGVVVVTDARPRVASLTELRIERLPGGAIVRATGLAPTQGWFNAELVRVGAEDGVLTYEFRAEQPPGFAATGTIASRTITAADVLGADEVGAIGLVRVLSATNALQAGP